MKAFSPLHPCQSCGACCAYFRVGFYWREAESENQPNPVPVRLTEDIDSFKRVMIGTNQKQGTKCIALEGRVGRSVSCRIYESRPSVCRNFKASYSDGLTKQKRCDEAREAHGLKPLTPEDWPTPARTISKPEASEPHAERSV